ncbi:MAG: 16S rRNA (guanine(966)-N(2))-methyltransferase RsmD [Cyanobacteria bacterium J06623_4]
MAVRIYGNREIKTLPGEATRPTSARVREALFNIWQGRVRGARWLDLCAGSGAMGAEALCRGAASAVGIERSGAACRVISQNWQKVAKPTQPFRVIKGDVLKQMKTLCASTEMLSEGRTAAKERDICLFDLIYFDPPYAGNLYEPVLSQLAVCLAPKGEVAVEYGEGQWCPRPILEKIMPRLEIVRQKRYGSTHLIFLRGCES